MALNWELNYSKVPCSLDLKFAPENPCSGFRATPHFNGNCYSVLGLYRDNGKETIILPNSKPGDLVP